VHPLLGGEKPRVKGTRGGHTAREVAGDNGEECAVDGGYVVMAAHFEDECSGGGEQDGDGVEEGDAEGGGTEDPLCLCELGVCLW
jgi:hypothetical protein